LLSSGGEYSDMRAVAEPSAEVLDMTCNTCGGAMIQRSRPRLLLVGVLMIASVGLAFHVPYFWAPGLILLLLGAYLVLWATLGKGQWCRTCKKFNI
jgi:hypothetical protein